MDGARLAEASAGSWRCEVGLLLPGRRVGGQGLLGGRGRRSGRKGVQGWGGRLELMAGGAAVHKHVPAGATPDAARRHARQCERGRLEDDSCADDIFKAESVMVLGLPVVLFIERVHLCVCCGGWGAPMPGRVTGPL